jgi:hypothetical protein
MRKYRTGKERKVHKNLVVLLHHTKAIHITKEIKMLLISQTVAWINLLSFYPPRNIIM